MDIIDLLIEDHGQLRNELSAMRQTLYNLDLRHRIKAFISAYELHESVEEDILFPGVEDAIDRKLYERLQDYETSHEKIWDLLEQLMDSSLISDPLVVQRAFFLFSASAEAHFRQEERELFPLIRAAVAPSVLEGLGKKAQARFVRFRAK